MHAPANLAPKIFQFLRRDVNKAFRVEVAGTTRSTEVLVMGWKYPACALSKAIQYAVTPQQDDGRAHDGID